MLLSTEDAWPQVFALPHRVSPHFLLPDVQVWPGHKFLPHLLPGSSAEALHLCPQLLRQFEPKSLVDK